MDLNCGDLKLQMKKKLKISSSNRPKLFPNKVKFYSIAKSRQCLLFLKNRFNPWSLGHGMHLSSKFRLKKSKRICLELVSDVETGSCLDPGKNGTSLEGWCKAGNGRGGTT
jgi:hypothetical protein